MTSRIMRKTTSPSRRRLVALAATATVLVAAAASPALAQTDPKATADEHFRKGVAAFRDGRFGDAKPEFEEAYRLSPAFPVLYNIGQVNVSLGHSVEAVEAYEKYLKQGATKIPVDRVHEVEAEIARQQDRIGTVVVRTTPEGAELRMDTRLLGKSPLGRPVRATIGLHTFEAILPGYVPRLLEVEVVGRAERHATLTLEPDPVRVEETRRAAEETRRATEEARRATEDARRTPTPAVAPVVTVVEVPRPEAAPAARSAPVATAVARESSINWQRIVGYVFLAGGLATTTAGGLMAYDGSNKAAEARNRSMMTPAELDAAIADYNAANHRNHVGWTVAGIGAAALVGGIVLIATAPDRSAGLSVALAPVIAPDTRGLSLAATW